MTITVTKRGADGVPQLSYTGEWMGGGDGWICLTAIFTRATRDAGYVVFATGDRFTEWFYADRHYNVFRIDDGMTGALKGWYCNITRPAVITPETVTHDDLALDVWIAPDRSALLLDEDEFTALTLSDDERAACWRAVDEIRTLAAAAIAPF